ncbi:hypothetical protein ACOMHN_054337 [Nucella lapillus]
MEKLCTVTIFLAALICIGQVSEASEMEDLKARLTSLEANQQVLRDLLQTLEQGHDRDVTNMTQFCEDLRGRVEEQREVLRKLQEELEGRSTASPPSYTTTSSPVSASTPSFENCGPCSPDNYTHIDDPRRVVAGEYSGYEDMCDKQINPGWYRFQLNGENAVIPTSCIPENNCHTDAPTWLDLQGQSLPAIGQLVDARACSHWSDDCCRWEAPITVLNCGEFYVYKLEPLPTCDLSFCVEEQS